MPGMFVLALPLVAAPSVFRMMRDGPFALAGAPPSMVLGALIIGHLAFVLTFAAIAWVSIATGLVLRFQHAPLRAHTAVLPLALLHEVVVIGIARSACFALVLFYGLHWRLLRTVTTSPLAWATHIVLMGMALTVIGAALFSSARRTILRAPDPSHRALLANRRGVFCALFAILGGFGAEALLGQRAPWVLERIGDIGAAGAVFLVPPLYVVTAKSALPAGILLLVGTISMIVLWRAAVRSAPGWVTDVPVDHCWAPAYTPPRLLALIVGRGAFRRVSTFAAKDLLLPVVRAPARHFVQQWFALAAMAGVLILVRFAVSGARDAAAPVLFPVIVTLYALIQAQLSTLHLLGMEGRRIALLMPVLPPRVLVLLKGAPAIFFVTVHTVAGVVLLLLLGFVLGFSDIPVTGAVVVAIAAGIITAVLGVAAGFLFPDFERRSVSSPGATIAGRLAFNAIGGLALGIFAILQSIAHGGSLPLAMVRAAMGILVALVAVLAMSMGYAGVRRLSRLEI